MVFSGKVKTEDPEGNYNLCFCAAFQPGGSQTSSQSEETQTSAAASPHSCGQERPVALADNGNRDLHQYDTGNLTGRSCVELLLRHTSAFSLTASSSQIKLRISSPLSSHGSPMCGKSLVSYK